MLDDVIQVLEAWYYCLVHVWEQNLALVIAGSDVQVWAQLCWVQACQKPRPGQIWGLELGFIIGGISEDYHAMTTVIEHNWQHIQPY
jgi:hypothetical protein